MIKKTSRGFTLIELLVVIAIIGILSAIVLASLGQARSKANDAKVEGQLSQMRSAAEIYYSTNGNYGAATTACDQNMFNDSVSGLQNLFTSTASTTGVTAANVDCGSTGTLWSVEAKLPSGAGYFCVDSTGASRGASTSTPGTAYSTFTGSVSTSAHINAGQAWCD